MEEFIRPTNTELTLNEWIKSFEYNIEEQEPPYNDFCFYL